MSRTPFTWFAVLALAASCAAPSRDSDQRLIFYPDPPAPPRVQFLRTVAVGSDIEQGRSSLDSLLFGGDFVEKEIRAPYGCALREGVLYVCDLEIGDVLKLDFVGHKLGVFGAQDRGRFLKPANLSFADDGALYVADLGRRQIVVFDPEQNYLTEYGPFGEDSRPVDVEVAGEYLYVVDSGSKCVRMLDRATGEELRTFGQEETLEARLRAPTNVCVGDDGSLFVVDTIDCRIFVWDADGEFVGHVGSAGDTVGQFARPKGIACWNDLLFVVDAAFENCQIIDRDDNPLMFFGGSGVGPGNLYLPSGIWIGSEGLDLFEDYLDDDFEAECLIVVCNLYGPRKVNFYAFGKSRDFEYPEEEPGKPQRP